MEDRDREPLHQFRVSLRYLLSLSKAFGLSTQDSSIGPAGKIFRQLLRHAGPVRDLDVQLITIERWRASREIPSGTLEKFALFLRDLRNIRHQMLGDQLATLVPVIPPATHEFPGVPTISPDWMTFLSGRKTRVKNRLNTLSLVHDPLEKIKLLHTVRILLKSIRYPISVLNEFSSGHLDSELILFKQVQDILGSLHDNEVILGSLNAFSRTDQSPNKGLVTIIEECDRIRQWQLDRFIREWGEHRLIEFLDNVLDQLSHVSDI